MFIFPEKEGNEENNEKLNKLIEERYQNLEMGRKIFENAYRFFENSENDEEKEFEQTQQVPEKVSMKRRRSSSKSSKRSTKAKETFAVSQKEQCEPEVRDVNYQFPLQTALFCKSEYIN